MRWVNAVMVLGVLSGCAASVTEIRHHPQQDRLARIVEAVRPHTSHPEVHYWVRASHSPKQPIGLAVFPQRHVYVDESLIKEADDAILTALVVHGVAHHRLHHGGQRMMINLVQRGAFKAGGFFVPGLSHGHRLGGPLIEVMLNAGQEPQADEKTVEYLTEMGRSGQDWRRALEFLAEHGYAERVGNVMLQREDFTNRIAALRTPMASAAESTAPDSGR